MNLTPEEIQDVKQKADEFRDQTFGGVTPRMQEMLTYWKRLRPKMYASLKRAGILEDYATVREGTFLDESLKLIKSGMQMREAESQVLDELLMTPEADDPPEIPEENQDEYSLQA